MRSSAARPGSWGGPPPQYGANTLDVTRDLEHRLEVLAPALEQHGVKYHPALLRPASFIGSAIAKLRNSLLIDALLVVGLLLVARGDAAGRARGAHLLQRHSGIAPGDGMDPRHVGAVAEHHEPRRPGGGARGGG